MKIKKRTTWFCGCKKIINDYNLTESFISRNDDHEEYFDKKRMATVKVCHKSELISISEYTLIEQ